MDKKNVVVIGGGTGTYTVLHGLKKYKDSINISAIVTMADSGGSTGRLRDEFGYLPVGDVRMALAALANDTESRDNLLRELFLYRFSRGDSLSGQNVGNLLLVALSEILGSEEEAIASASKLLKVSGTVLPVTVDHVNLVAEYEDGVTIVGEHEIDEPEPSRSKHKITNLYTEPKAVITESASNAIAQADLIILGPGDVFTSVLANCVVEGVSDAISLTKAKVAYVCNLMTKLGQTDNMKVSDHVEEITKYSGRRPDFVIVNKTPLPEDLLAKYADSDEWPVILDEVTDTVVVPDNLLATEEITQVAGDTLKRSFIRHDSHKLADQVMALVKTL